MSPPPINLKFFVTVEAELHEDGFPKMWQNEVRFARASGKDGKRNQPLSWLIESMFGTAAEQLNIQFTPDASMMGIQVASCCGWQGIYFWKDQPNHVQNSSKVLNRNAHPKIKQLSCNVMASYQF